MNQTLWHWSELAAQIAEEVGVEDAGRANDARDIARQARADAERLGPEDIDAVVLARQVIDDLGSAVTGRYPVEASRPLTPPRVAVALLSVLIGLGKAPRSGDGYRGTALAAAADVAATLRFWETDLPWFVLDDRIEEYGALLCPRPVAGGER